MKLRFREKISKIQLFGSMLVPAVGTGLFMRVAISGTDNLLLSLIIVGFCGVVWLFVFWHLRNRAGMIELTDYAIKVANRGYFKGALVDLRTQVVIINNRLWIPYEEVLDITVEEGNIYLNFLGISSNVVLHPVDIEGFLSALSEKVSIDIKYNNPVKNDAFVFKHVFNTPTKIFLAVLFVLFQIPGIWNIVHGRGFAVFITLGMMMLMFIVAISVLHKMTYTLTDKEIVKHSKYGDHDLGIKKISYANIIEVIPSKWYVTVKFRNGSSAYFYPDDFDFFHFQLQRKLEAYRKQAKTP